MARRVVIFEHRAVNRSCGTHSELVFVAFFREIFRLPLDQVV